MCRDLQERDSLNSNVFVEDITLPLISCDPAMQEIEIYFSLNYIDAGCCSTYVCLPGHCDLLTSIWSRSS